jgi:hypothetical protein
MIIFSRNIFSATIILLITLINFVLWYYIGKSRSATTCNYHKIAKQNSLPCYSNKIQSIPAIKDGHCTQNLLPLKSGFTFMLTNRFMRYKEDFLLNIRYPEWSILMADEGNSRQCQRIVNPFMASRRQYSCLAIVKASIGNSLNLLRHEEIKIKTEKKETDDTDEEPEEKKSNMTGFFGNVGNENSRILLRKKFSPLLSHLPKLEKFLLKIFSRRGLHPGDDLVLMVLNPGEIDIFANFICSCHQRNISTSSVVVFTSSVEIVPLIRSFGVIAVFHEESFALAPVRANFEYLDRTFIDMMWYKSFSVWICLKLGFSVLFQDIDLVWFRDPFEYFSELANRFQLEKKGPIDAFLSDDGQRSLRYAPFYANSGFYYLKANRRTIYYSWSIMTAFTILHITGSHQNVFTLRLLESLDLSAAGRMRTAFLPMPAFPSGVKFSHDRSFMQRIYDGLERPFVFHMCWTINKYHKIRNFKAAAMWFLRPEVAEYLDQLGNGQNSNSTTEEEERERVRRRKRGEREQLQLRPSDLLETAVQLEEKEAELEKRWAAMRPRVCLAGKPTQSP